MVTSDWLIGAAALMFAVAVVAAAAFYFGTSGRTRSNSVAVLPFFNASGDPNAEYLSDGITEGVIDRLSGLPEGHFSHFCVPLQAA